MYLDFPGNSSGGSLPLPAGSKNGRHRAGPLPGLTVWPSTTGTVCGSWNAAPCRIDLWASIRRRRPFSASRRAETAAEPSDICSSSSRTGRSGLGRIRIPSHGPGCFEPPSRSKTVGMCSGIPASQAMGAVSKGWSMRGRTAK